MCIFCAKLLGGPPWFLHWCVGQGEEWTLSLSRKQWGTQRKHAERLIW